MILAVFRRLAKRTSLAPSRLSESNRRMFALRIGLELTLQSNEIQI